MITLNAFLFTEDALKFAAGIVVVTLAIFIIWLLLREMRLWYWKINNLIKMLKKIEKRIRHLEILVNELSKDVASIDCHAIKLSDNFTCSDLNHDEEEAICSQETEEEIARRIKD